MRRIARFFHISVYIVIATLLLTGLMIIGKKYYQLYSIQNHIHKTYENQVKTLIPAAVQYLQNNQNDWIVCTDLGLSLENIDDPKIMAAWIAYYRHGKTYCTQWWDWPHNDPCAYMQKQEKYVTNSDKIMLLKKITLCKIAQQQKN